MEHRRSDLTSTNRNASADKPTTFEGVILNILDSLSDKDETVRVSLQNALVKIMETHPDSTSNILVNYREKQTKIPEHITETLLRIIEHVVKNTNNTLPPEATQRFCNIALEELIRSTEHVPIIQNQALSILVIIGKTEHCSMVVETILKQNNEGGLMHFMAIQCLGKLASENVNGMVPFVRRILTRILPSLAGIKLDHVKEAFAYGIGRFSEALLEHVHGKTDENATNVESINLDENLLNCSTEISVAYDVLFNQWLTSRELKVLVAILHALSSMYPLLLPSKIKDQALRLIPQILALYRRSIERNSVTQFLSSVLKTNIELQPNALDSVSDQLISNLFDLVCVYPDYEKPQTVKGHYEVLRCFHLLSNVYSNKIMDTLHIHLRNNSERERIKSLLILTHLLNTSTVNIEKKLTNFIDYLKQMIHNEKSIKMKMTLLKTIVVLAQKSLINHKEFVWFIVRYSCKYNKVNQEYGTIEEHANFVQLCENSLCMLSSTAGTIDELLKRELLNYFVLLDYTDICTNLAKCLANLFAKSPNIEFEINDETDRSSGDDETHGAHQHAKMHTNIKDGKIIVPSAEMILARCFALLGNHQCIKRSSNILNFMKYYYPHLNPDLYEKLWCKSISDLLLCIDKESLYTRKLLQFINETVEFLNSYDKNFAQRLVIKMGEQIIMYPITIPHNEFIIPSCNVERGMWLKSIALTLCFVTDIQLINTKIDLIITSAKQEKLDKHVKSAEYELKIEPCALALGYISRVHFQHLIKKLAELAHIGGRKHSTSFFSNFIKDTQKEYEIFKTNLLVIKSFGYIMDESDPLQSLLNLDDTILNFLILHLSGAKDQIIMSAILKTLLSICNQIIATKEELTAPLKYRKQIMEAVFSIPIEAPFNDLPLLPTILKLGTDFIRIGADEQVNASSESVDGGVIFEIACKNFFGCAQNLKMKFDSQEDDDRNSYLAKHLNISLPELNALVKAIIELDPSPVTLDLLISILESWIRDKNSEVRICASHVYNNILEVYMKSMNIGCEAPSKFNQTGQMLGKIVPRCIDSNGTVRQVSVDILQKTLEISCIYETLTIADSETDWVKEIEMVKETIITDDPKMIYTLAGTIAKIISLRMSNFQYLQFCKTLLQCLQDPEQSSSIGSSVVLKFFIQQKGSELFHAIPDLVKDGLIAIKTCNVTRSNTGVLKALVALTKHHPKLVCCEILAQDLPYDEKIVEYWHLVCTDLVLTEAILDNFIHILKSTSFLETNEKTNERQKIANIQPLAIICALREIMPCKDINTVLKAKFADLFTILLTSIATYTNIAAPLQSNNAMITSRDTITNHNALKSKLTAPNRDKIKLNPCQIVLDTFQFYLNNLEMEQISTVLTVDTQLANSTDLRSFIELLTPLAIGLVNQFGISSSDMKHLVFALGDYTASPNEGERVAAIGLFSRLVPLCPCGDISTNIMSHLCVALSDPNAIVRGLSIQSMGYISNLSENDIERYSDNAIQALLKGIDDVTGNECPINIPLESMRGLSRNLQNMPSYSFQSFHVSLAIRIRPFFANNSAEIREVTITLFGDLCESKMLHESNTSPTTSTEALHEQLIAYLFALILHLSENDQTVVSACKGALRKVCPLLSAPRVNEMAQEHLMDHTYLNYNVFLIDFVKMIATELTPHVQDFIECCIPKLRSQWEEVRAYAAITIGVLNNYLMERNYQTEAIGSRIATLLKDESAFVRSKAANAIGYFFGEI